ncbi:MAG TPA: aminopeptidase [Gemmatimonadales bacterium]|jgi:predicted aminopeptidase
MTVRRAARLVSILAAVLILLFGIAYAAFADVRYITRAAIAEAGILHRSRPIVDVVADNTTDPRVRAKLLLVIAARAWAHDSLGLTTGDTYTTYSQLDHDTLVLVLSAAPNDKLEPYTWSFPVVGRVPYKGFFDPAAALSEAQKLQRAGLDTYVRPASAFSTLGWFNDPLLSTVVRDDSSDLAATIIHETLHNTLFLKGHVDFNESLAEFTGYRGAELFFRSRGDSVNARRSAARWRDIQRLARFYEALVARLDRVYKSGASGPQIQAARNQVFSDALEQMAGPLAAELETINGKRLAERPLNNASLLAERVYGTGLDRFDRFLDAHGGDLRASIAAIKRLTAGGGNPWAVLGMQ